MVNESDAKIITGTKSSIFFEEAQKGRIFILELSSFEVAKKYYYSEKYQKAKEFALKTIERTFSIIEGI